MRRSLRRTTSWGIVATLLAAVALFVQNSDKEPPAPGHFRVKRIVDGDTVVVEGNGVLMRVRLAGIDAPEMGRKGVPGQPYAERSREYLSSLINSCDVEMRQVGIDDFNRPLVFFTCGDVDVNLRMVEQGMAEVYRGRTKFDVSPLVKADEQARRQRRNIWSQKDYESPRDWRRRHQNGVAR